DDLSGLGDDVAEADLLVLFGEREVLVVAASGFAERLPRLYRHLAVGLRRQRQDHLGRVNVALDPRQALGWALVGDDTAQALQQVDFVLGIPGHALAAVA